MVAVREQSVDAVAARTAGVRARNARVAAARADLAAARRQWIRDDAALAALKFAGASQKRIGRARARAAASLAAIAVAAARLDEAKAPRRARR